MKDYLKLITDGPKNKWVYYLLYLPALLLIGICVMFLLMGVLPELIAWFFGAACLIWIIIWPISKVYELITGNKIL